jgi:hypothetical protein
MLPVVFNIGAIRITSLISQHVAAPFIQVQLCINPFWKVLLGIFALGTRYLSWVMGRFEGKAVRWA